MGGIVLSIMDTSRLTEKDKEKLQADVQLKLKELGVALDDDSLPQYVMMLLANNHTREHVASELEMFVEGQGEFFTEWLWGSVEALQKGQAPDGGLSSEIVQVGGSEPKKVQSSRLLSNAIGKATQSTK